MATPLITGTRHDDLSVWSPVRLWGARECIYCFRRPSEAIFDPGFTYWWTHTDLGEDPEKDAGPNWYCAICFTSIMWNDKY